MSETDRIARAYQDLEERAGGRWSQANRGNQAIVAEQRRMVARLLGGMGWVPVGERDVLEVGSGGGGTLASLCDLGADPRHLVGVDLLGDRVAAARKAFPEIEFRQGNAERLDFPDSSFDLVLAFTVFSSIHDRSMARNVAREITRVLSPGGALLWYDVRYNSTNRNVRAVTRARIGELFPTLRAELHTVTLLPPLARRLGPLTGAGYPVLAAMPPLRSHLIGLLHKPAA
jgi:SAM-dependent methyltransferase